jgi:PAB1-binding protein PBP1
MPAESDFQKGISTIHSTIICIHLYLSCQVFLIKRYLMWVKPAELKRFTQKVEAASEKAGTIALDNKMYTVPLWSGTIINYHTHETFLTVVM